eukprot:TRINITY_DN1184_c2_g2_i1.p1 TRINITY_DN1184_c2_g2~~TRINITY_DN1184_c2_g2_i1.p1  ORF type:complete len:446 (+),score=75.31 TRINITY_DN1184_c2_g2_i1:154-1491(+)
MARARLMEHAVEGLPWMIGATVACTYFWDAVHNESRGNEAVTGVMRSAFGSGAKTLKEVADPALSYLNDPSLMYSDDEKFLNKPMEEQLQALLEWFNEKDYERGFHYLAVFAKDRGSPHTDWPINDSLRCPALIDKIVEARRCGVMTPGLFASSLSALAQMPDNANQALKKDTINLIVHELQHAKNELDTVFTLKLLTLIALHQPKSGMIEKMLIENKLIIPTLLTILQDESNNVFETKYPTQLLSVMLRVDPACLSDMEGKYVDSSGNPLTIYRSIREGLRFKNGFSVPYYVRLARDLFVVDEERAVKGFIDAEFMDVIIGLLRNNFNYIEVVQPLVRMQRMLVERMENPAEVLTYTDFLTIMSTVVEKSGVYQPTITDDVEETLSIIMHDVNIPQSYVMSKQAMLQRYLQTLSRTKTTPKLRNNDHWIASDLKKMNAARVLPV